MTVLSLLSWSSLIALPRPDTCSVAHLGQAQTVLASRASPHDELLHVGIDSITCYCPTIAFLILLGNKFLLKSQQLILHRDHCPTHNLSLIMSFRIAASVFRLGQLLSISSISHSLNSWNPVCRALTTSWNALQANLNHLSPIISKAFFPSRYIKGFDKPLSNKWRWSLANDAVAPFVSLIEGSRIARLLDLRYLPRGHSSREE
jgi:hypothetical protein